MKRCYRYDVGKEIGGCIYVHKQYRFVFLMDGILKAEAKVPEGFDFQVVKYDSKKEQFSFICSPDFDTADEPTVGDSIVVNSLGKIKTVKANKKDPWIYHHKWLMVMDDYSGFNVEKSKRRSESWMSIDGIDKKKIGKKSYWEKILCQHQL